MPVKSFLLSLILIFGISLKSYSFNIPELTSPVIDEVGLLSGPSKQQIETSLYDFKRNHGVQIQVYIAASLQGEVIESATIKLFDAWKLGDEKTDKGLLFLIVPSEKRMRIEVGQGLEGDVPDVIAKRIISDVVRPDFQKGKYSLGIAEGVSSIQNYILNGEPPDQKAKDESRGSEKQGGLWIALVILVLWILLFIFNPSLALYILFSAMRGGGGGGSSGGSGGDSWGGGGGSSSGGGASGSW